jgi:hypothetical protein
VKLTFTQISQSVQDTIRDANAVKEEITDSVEKQKLVDQIKLLRSAAAQFVQAGQAYNSQPTNANETKMNDAEIIMGRCNNIVVDLMEAHSKGVLVAVCMPESAFLLFLLSLILFYHCLRDFVVFLSFFFLLFICLF